MIGPLHPIDVMLAIAYRTPAACEGSLGHLRSDLAWEIAEDQRRLLAGDRAILENEYEEGWTPTRSAVALCTRWTNDDAAVANDDRPSRLATIFPNGRTMYYEGDEPAAFVAEAQRLGLGEITVSIHVPADKLDAAQRFPLGT